MQDFGEASSEMEMTDVPENTASHVDGRNAVVANVEGKTLGCSKNSKKKTWNENCRNCVRTCLQEAWRPQQKHLGRSQLRV